MTDENIRANIADELALADSALRAAESLLGLALAPDAASRTYYAAFHGARALLLSVGVETTSHRALRSMLSKRFVKTGILAAERSKDLTQLEALRTAGDYDAAFALGVQELQPELDKARRFLVDVREILRRDGWLD